MDTSLLTVTCPRCGSAVEQRFYGPCRTCVNALYAKFAGEARAVETEDYVPKMNVTPNAVALKDEFSALENLQLGCALAGDRADAQAACDALQRVGLKGRWHLPVRSLSQGQRRRAALARLWLTKRRLWLLDEPLASLDVARLHLDYKESKRTDAHGNRFRYRAKVDDAKGAKVNRWAWDVFLVPGR